MVSYIVRHVERSLDFDINQRDKLQRTALHWAAELNRLEVAEALIDYGIDPAATECNGRYVV
jgi:ankyrin repeat protein